MSVLRGLIFILVFSISTTTFAAAPSCTDLCKNNTDAIKGLINDAKCKADAKCVQCVANGIGLGSMSDYCTSLNSQTTSTNGQVVSTTLHYIAGGTCAASCVMQMIPQTTAAGQVLARVCTGLGLGSAAYDFVTAITTGDLVGSTLPIATQIPLISKELSVMKTNMSSLAGTAKDAAATKAKGAACTSALTILAMAGLKKALVPKMQDSQKQQCDLVNRYGGMANSAVISCQNAPPSPGPTGDGQPGLYAVTSGNNFLPSNLDDAVKRLGATQSDQFLKDMQGDMEKAASLGKFDYAAIQKKVADGASTADILSSFGLPKETMAAIDQMENQLKSGKKFASLDSLNGGYSLAGSGGGETAGQSGLSELAFGQNSATPSEGAADSLEIDRKVASKGLAEEGDVYHTAFGGTIFDIVSGRIKGAKSNYAELEPVGRMNRAFNGYTNPKAPSGSAK